MGVVKRPMSDTNTDEMQKLVDSVMVNLKALLQEMSDTVRLLDKQHLERSRELQDRYYGYGGQMYERTDEEERKREQEQRACDELYDRAKTTRDCMGWVAGKVNNIIGENIVIQFSKWNMK
jgi:hypothetical protein